jgi:glycosyltransferase involved in cell wall biosynthesis
MLVSIGMPVYNRPIEMTRALNSVLAQTYQDIEIIISNNCSPNVKVDEILKEYLQRDSRIKYYFQENALPVIDNFKFVLEKASGEYFLWLSDDDWIDNNYVEECLNYLKNNPDYNLTCGQCHYHNKSAEFLSKIKMPSLNSANPSQRVIEYYKNVKLNGYFYGMRKTLLSREIPLQNKMAFDWLYLAAIVYRGKSKVLENVSMHITAAGMSSDTVEMNKNIGANNFFTQNFVGLTSSVNAALDIFKATIYPANTWFKVFFSIRIFFTVFSKTMMWDIIHIKRLLFGKKNNYNNGL